MMVTVAVVGILAAIAIPSLIKSRNTASRNACILNLKEIDGAIQQWALDKKKSGTALVTTTDILAYMKGSVLPICLAQGTYSTTKVNAAPTCTESASGHSL